jgi:hypothetical protein
MKVLGDWNWYLPKWLEWLPHVGAEGELPPAEPEPEPAPVDSPEAPEPAGAPA